MCSALALGAAAPAAAGSAPPPEPLPRTAAEMLRPVSPPAARQADREHGNPGPADLGTFTIADGDGLETARTSRPLAPGVELGSYDRLESDTWLRVDSISVDLTRGTRVDYLHPGKVAARQTVSRMAAEHDPGPGRRTVAAVNGDFFDINQTGAPSGIALHDGRLVNSPAPGRNRAVGVGPGDAGRVLQLYFEGTLTLPAGTRPLAALNAADVPANGVGAYNAQWGEADRALTVDGARRAAEVAVADGKVTAAAGPPGKGPVPPGATVLVGRDAGADALTALAVGDPVGWEYRPRAATGEVPRTAIGAGELLVVDGEPVEHEGGGNDTAAPRTAVGFSRDGAVMRILTVDGRQADSGGVTLTELGLMMRREGAHNAVNLDGGGSSTLVAREPGSDTMRVENSPSDGTERPVPNGLALTAPDGSGELRGYRVGTAMDPGAAPTADPVRGGHPERVFPGLTRRLTAAGYDETYGPAEGAPHWYARNPLAGRAGPDGVFTARHSGSTDVIARRGSARGVIRLTVLGELDRIRPSVRRVGLADAQASGRFGVLGLDAHGTSAPVEPSDVRLDYDRSLFDIAPDAEGFTVRARTAEPVAGRVTATVAGRSTVVAVTVGLAAHQVASFDDAGRWTFTAARASGSVAPTADGRTGTGLDMAYDFTQSTATRAAYAHPPAQIPVDGQPQSFGLWVKGDGNGAWPTLHLKDQAGSDQLLRGPYVTWTGWRHVEFAVPAGVSYPLRVHRVYLAETAATRSYRGRVVFDELTAMVPPPVALPAEPVHRDPLVGTAAKTASRDWRFAVLSDAQFVARSPDSQAVAQARRTLREIRAARPDFVVVNGDLVDEGSPADLAFARTVLEEELGGGPPWYYVPGNHEVMGGGIDDFVAEFGPARRTFDHKGTRFITLDTSSLGLRGGGLAQIRELRAQLDAAAADPRVGSVLVVQHVPPRDPTPQQGSRLADRKEAALLEGWLSAFRLSTGKGAAFVGAHVGTFHAERVDGVPYLVNGNSGKAPSTPADEGGFTGWSLVGVDRVSPAEQAVARHLPWTGGPDWVTVQTRAHVDGLTLDAPASVPAGTGAPVTALVRQGQGPGAREVPARFPVSTDWSGSPDLYVGDPARARPWHVAAYDPSTGRLTGLRPGTAVLAVTVNGTRTESRVTVAASPASYASSASHVPPASYASSASCVWSAESASHRRGCESASHPLRAPCARPGGGPGDATATAPRPVTPAGLAGRGVEGTSGSG
ncbi:multidrug transporter [Streptomyces sp. PKU-MA01144]|uniref:phosphodiester glycosidase family protein n=1 Tax=Streptomyces sp. PKU-MA01144 TaxID=2729138 RepID=UPI0014803CAF|nr:phosphodiester glycosidase family protein [Streptomyces sp. PKU-MA01144]NNJ07034.1 multidrug transporter [Streptomyces sp. PKU-MA01144]